jgi:hypothetical protein
MSAAVNSSSHADTDERHFESHKKRGRQENQIKIHRQNWKRRKKGEQVRRRTHASRVSQWPLSSNREVGLVCCKSTCIYIGLSGAKRCVYSSVLGIVSCVYIVRVMWPLTDGDQAQMYDVRTGTYGERVSV